MFTPRLRAHQRYCRVQCCWAAHRRPHPRPDAARRQRIGERDGWICWICSEPVDRALLNPHPLSASLDHVLPLARGGRNSPDNIKLAHLRCNVRRGARDMSRATVAS